MDRTRPTLNQRNIVSGELDASIAFCRRPGVDRLARFWSKGWAGRADVAGRAVVGVAAGLMGPVSDAHRPPPPEV
jgi:hypothetical protein